MIRSVLDYDKLAADYAVSRRVHPEIVAALVRALAGVPVRAAVEIGCGTGNYAAALGAATGAFVVGVEPSREMAAHAQAAGVACCRGTAEAAPLRGSAFGLVYAVDVVHHLRDVRPLLGEARRLLRPRGLLCLATDAERVLATRRPLAVYWPETVASELARYHPIPRLRQWLAELGFQDVCDEEVAFPYLLHDAEPYRRRAFSTLQRIPDGAWQRGLAQMEADLAQGPIPCNSRYTLVWARR
jgi:SAM-dependent methyltransferase